MLNAILFLEVIVNVMSDISGFTVQFLLMIMILISIVAVLTNTSLITWFVILKAWTVFFQAMWFFTWAVYKGVTRRVYNLLFLLIRYVVVHSISLIGILLFKLVLNLFFLLFNQTVSVILAALAFTKVFVTFSALSVTATIHFEAFYIFA